MPFPGPLLSTALPFGPVKVATAATLDDAVACMISGIVPALFFESCTGCAASCEFKPEGEGLGGAIRLAGEELVGWFAGRVTSTLARKRNSKFVAGGAAFFFELFCRERASGERFRASGDLFKDCALSAREEACRGTRPRGTLNGMIASPGPACVTENRPNYSMYGERLDVKFDGFSSTYHMLHERAAGCEGYAGCIDASFSNC